jgi:hypothetical protein
MQNIVANTVAASLLGILRINSNLVALSVIDDILAKEPLGSHTI